MNENPRMMAKPPREKPTIFTDRMRLLTGNIINPMGMQLHTLGVHPDMVTIAGFVMVALASVVIGLGQLQWGAILLFFALPFDALDGAVARAMQRKGQFGAVLDSSLDRYADGFIFAGLSYYFATQGQLVLLILAQAALLGSLLVSYVRARGEGVNVQTKIGLFTRLERILVILLMLLFPPLLVWGVVILALGTNFTALQRLFFIRETLSSEGD